MAKITRQEFIALLQDQEVDVEALLRDPRMRGIDVAGANRNGNRVIDGEAEWQEIWRRIDNLDNDGSYGSMNVTTGSRVGDALQTLGEFTGIASLRTWANQIGREMNDDIVLVGMNEGAAHEARELNRAGHATKLFKDAAVNDTITVRGKTYDLTDAEELRSFVAMMALPPEQSAKIVDAFNAAGSDVRDELAQLAWEWAKRERGEAIPSRLVLSGHSVGGGVWGDDNGYLQYEPLAMLALAMPEAARSVEDLCIAGCYSAGEQAAANLKAMFPSVSTIWFYEGSAPGSYSGATAHLSRWANATKGRAKKLDRDIVRGIRKGENVATWSVDGGYQNGRPSQPIASVHERVQASMVTFRAFFSGAEEVADTQEGPLRDHYNNLQALWQHPELPNADRPNLKQQIEQTIRLIYYKARIASRFMSHYADPIRAGFEALRTPAIDFGRLSRKEALEKIVDLERRAGADAPVAARTLVALLTKGLRDLSTESIPSGWV